jgi:hypothetical protein
MLNSIWKSSILVSLFSAANMFFKKKLFYVYSSLINKDTLVIGWMNDVKFGKMYMALALNFMKFSTGWTEQLSRNNKPYSHPVQCLYSEHSCWYKKFVYSQKSCLCYSCLVNHLYCTHEGTWTVKHASTRVQMWGDVSGHLF